MFLDTKTKYPFLHSGEIYDASESDLFSEQRKCLVAQFEFNNTSPLDLEKRDELVKKMFCSVGKNCFIEGPVRMNFGGNHVILGDGVYINSDFCAVDDTFITIGDYTFIGPRVVIATALHPEDVERRKIALQYNKPVNIGKYVWLGANVTVCPGVTIGEGAIIGAGSVVTRDIPPYVVAVGNPCKPIRPVRDGEHGPLAE